MAGAAFFDLDKTVIARASMAAFSAPFYRGGLISKSVVVRALYNQLLYLYMGAGHDKLEKIRGEVLKLTKGWDRNEVVSIVEEALFESIDPILYKGAVEEIDWHEANGRRVWIVSASPEEIVKPLGRYLGVDGVIASKARVDESGRYTGELERYVYGQYKADIISEIAEKESIDLSESYAYSDSATDIPMLSIVGHPICVNPDRALLKTALENGWEVKKFKETISLAESRGLTPKKTATITGATFLTASIALFIGWLIGRHRKHAGSETTAKTS